MNFGFLGIQFGWALQLANMSAIYAKLGAEPDKIPILWLAGPVSGLIVQPIIGAASDRTWCVLGRRRPYFLVGAILAAIALFFMPDCPALVFAASLLWILDASINISMEPFRAFVADKLNARQQTQGFIMQSFFIGLGATIANAMPKIFADLGIASGQASNGIPLSVQYSFKIGAVVFLLCVLWTVISTREYPPRPNPADSNTANSVSIMTFLSSVFREIPQAVKEMPATMKQLALVQVFTWLGLFCMWMFFGLATAYHVFKAATTHDPAFDRAIEHTGWCFAIYSVVCFLSAFALPRLAARVGRKTVHMIALASGGLSLLAIYWCRSPDDLQYLMIGVGIAWASVLSMPYAMLAGSVPPARTGVYMGVFNLFIVLPEIIAALGFQPLVKYVLQNNPVYVVMLGGVSLLIAAACTTCINDSAAASPG